MNGKDEMRDWRWIPRVTYANYHKAFPTMPKNTFSKCFEVGRVWGGRIIDVRVKHHQLSFDFRRNWLADMVRGCSNAALIGGEAVRSKGIVGQED